MAPCPFCAVASGAAKASVVLRTGSVCAFLDLRPVFKGHVLLVPLRHVEDFAGLAPAELAPLFAAAQQVARAQEAALGAQGSFIAVNHRVSQSVPHVHVHVVPRTKGDGLRGFFWPRQRYDSDEEREAIAARIAGALPAGQAP